MEEIMKSKKEEIIIRLLGSHFFIEFVSDNIFEDNFQEILYNFIENLPNYLLKPLKDLSQDIKDQYDLEVIIEKLSKNIRERIKKMLDLPNFCSQEQKQKYLTIL